MMQRWYQQTLKWASHRYAVGYLVCFTFIESIFFPIPPDTLLIPMALARPERAYSFAGITLLSSVSGGVLAYFLGMYAFQSFGQELLAFFGYTAQFEKVFKAFETWDIYVLIISGFTPIPYKLITLSAGCVQMHMGTFLLGSCIGRGARFYLVAGLSRLAKNSFETVWLPRIAYYSNVIAIGMVCLIAAWYFR